MCSALTVANGLKFRHPPDQNGAGHAAPSTGGKKQKRGFKNTEAKTVTTCENAKKDVIYDLRQNGAPVNNAGNFVRI